MFPPGAIIDLKIHQNAFAAEPHWGSLQRSPRLLAGFQEPRQGRGGEEREGREVNEGKPRRSVLHFLKFNHCI